jgi:acetyl-CoA C-acetyltransferase
MTACIVGWAHSRFGKLEGEDIESLIIRVAGDAIADAGLEPAEIDEIFIGTMGAFVRQEFTSSLVLQVDPALRFKPATRVENACATGSAAIHQGLSAIAARRARHVLIVGVEKMTEAPNIPDLLIRGAYLKEEGEIEGGFAGVFGRIAQA